MAPRAAAKRSSCSSGFNTRGLLVGGLLAVIVVSLVWAVYSAVWGDSGQALQDQGMYFECQQCERQFVKRPDELSMRELNTDPSALRVDCPRCGAKASAIPCVMCPECDAYFVPASYSHPAEKRAGRAKDICPGCKTDRDEWYRRHYRGQ